MHGYRRVRADFARFAADLDPVPAAAGFDRPALLASLRTYFARRGIDANWEAVESMADDTLVTTLCMACPFEPAEKQALLEAPTPADRAGDAGRPAADGHPRHRDRRRAGPLPGKLSRRRSPCP